MNTWTKDVFCDVKIQTPPFVPSRSNNPSCFSVSKFISMADALKSVNSAGMDFFSKSDTWFNNKSIGSRKPLKRVVFFETLSLFLS